MAFFNANSIPAARYARCLGVAVALAGSILLGVNGGTLGSPMPVLAGGGSCVQFLNVLDSACVNDQNNDTYTGGSMSFDSRLLSINCTAANLPSGAHVNDSTWLYTGNPPNDTSASLEMGAWYGYAYWNTTNCNPNPGNSQIYYSNIDTVGNLTYKPITWIPQNGNNHVFQISRDTGNNQYWDEIYDGNVYYIAMGQHSSTAYEHAAGLEIGVSNYTQSIAFASAGTFHNALTVANMQGNWAQWTYFNTYRNHPCGSYAAGNCTNGSAPWVGEWDVNRG